MGRAIGFLGVAVWIAGCTTMAAPGPSAVATLEPTKGNTASGTVNFVQRGDKVLVTARVSGLAPGSHGFHIHEKGDCSSGDGMSAGGHFKPTGKPHREPYAPEHHAGNM